MVRTVSIVESPSLQYWTPTATPAPMVSRQADVGPSSLTGLPPFHEEPPLSLAATPAPAAAPLTAAVEQTAAATVRAATAPASPDGCPQAILDVFGEEAPAACAIAFCESRYNPLALGDHGVSYGLFQLHTGWAGPSGPYGWASWYGVAPADLYDPLINAQAAKAIHAYLGRWGGSGGWTCAARMGIW